MTETVKVLITEEELERRISEVAARIAEDYSGKKISLICVLKGGVIFMVDLARKLKQDVEFDFMDITSYGDGTESSGVIRVDKDVSDSIAGKDVLLVEDIIDSGRTLSWLVKHLRAQGPASVKICTLLDKPSRRVFHDVVPDYTCFEIPDEFVVGYGLDYAQRYRNLPYVGILQFVD
jgi:hypoxanthine phosphoribosyltransferase